MSREEIDSFILKFKTLLLSGKKATLVLKSDNGKAEVSLNVELGEVPPPPVHHRCQRNRDGPSRQRRRERRAAASKAENALKVVDINQSRAAEAISVDKETENKKEHDILEDEFCSDDSFKEKCSCPLEEEVVCDFVDKILVTHDEIQPIDTEKVVEEKLISVGIKVKKIESVEVEQGKSKVMVKVKPIDKKKVKAVEYPLSVAGWSIHCM
jgi:hypothetical protein